MAMAPILTVTVNPALDIATAVPQVVPGRKLRCGEPSFDSGGGGVNVSRAIHTLGGSSLAFLALGGATGTWYRSLLQTGGIDTEIWPLDGQTRVSLTVTEKARNQQFRFVLPGPRLTAAEAAGLRAAIERQISARPGIVVLSGSLLPGLPASFFGELAAFARAQRARVLLDSSGAGLKAALPFRPYLVKMDHAEAQELAGSDRDPLEIAPRIARRLVDRGEAEIALVTIGEGGVLVATPDDLYQIRPPAVEVVSAVGAGDSFTAALALGLARGWPLLRACRFGVAAAASAVTTPATQLCRRDQTLAFMRRISPRPERLPWPSPEIAASPASLPG